MNKISTNINFPLFGLLFLIGFNVQIFAQDVRYRSLYRFESPQANQAPKFGGMPDITLSKSALKKGIEGTFKIQMTLTKEASVKDVTFEKNVPQEVRDAVLKAYRTFRFSPAKYNDEPVDSKFFLEFTVLMVYQERSKGIKKPKILSKPKAVYPSAHLAEKRKGEVEVGILFKKDGSFAILSVNSTMPRDFDKAAREAAKGIKFTPAIHKKSKKKVTMAMRVVFKFKP